MPDDPKGAEATLAKAEQAYEKSVRDQMLPHVDGAVQTLGNLSKGKAVRSNQKPPSAMVAMNAAKTVLEYAGGKPETREPTVGNDGVTIVIQQFGEDAQRVVKEVIAANTKTLPSGMKKPSGNQVLEVAEGGAASIVRTVEVPD